MEEDFTISTLDENVSVISQLSDLPNVTDRLTATQLKAKFDEGNEKIKTYINDTMIPELEEHINDNLATKEEIQGIVLGEIPDGTLTSDKFNVTIKDSIEGNKYLYKFLVASVDSQNTTATDLYMTINSLDVTTLIEGQRISIHTPAFADTITTYYLNNLPINTDVKLIPNMDYEFIYTSGELQASTFEKMILRNLIFKELSFTSGQATLVVNGRCLGAVFQNLEYHTWFKSAVFTYDETTNKTTITNPRVGHYSSDDDYAYGFGLFIV